MNLNKPRLTKKYNGGFGLVKVKDDEQDVESPYPNTLKAILECFSRLGELENAIESGELVNVPETGIGDLSDGYHTFNELYHHRAILFSVICNLFPKLAWKSKNHDDGTMYDGMFIVGIETPKGQATYHYDIDPYYDLFTVKELQHAPKWDGHTPNEAINRIATLSKSGELAPVVHGQWIEYHEPWIVTNVKKYKCSACSAGNGDNRPNFCPNCAAMMDLEGEK